MELRQTQHRSRQTEWEGGSVLRVTPLRLWSLDVDESSNPAGAGGDRGGLCTGAGAGAGAHTKGVFSHHL
jgi:hypothetical protein